MTAAITADITMRAVTATAPVLIPPHLPAHIRSVRLRAVPKADDIFMTIIITADIIMQAAIAMALASSALPQSAMRLQTVVRLRPTVRLLPTATIMAEDMDVTGLMPGS